MDSFVIAVLVGGAIVILVFGLMMAFDKGKPAGPVPAAPPQKGGKR